MRKLEKVDEFRQEAKCAVFTRQQAMAITLQLLQRELKNEENTKEDVRVLSNAIQSISIKYLDNTQTETDTLLDSFNVARLTADDILKAIEDIMFDVQ